MNKNILLIGCGKEFGTNILNYFLENKHNVYHITSKENNISNKENYTEYTVNWDKITPADILNICKKLPNLDILFFNQNGSTLSSTSFNSNNIDTISVLKQIKHWSQTYFTSCQLPFLVVHLCNKKISDETKIFFMLSPLIEKSSNEYSDFADYISNKFTHLKILTSFSKHNTGTYIGVVPGIDLNNKNEYQLPLEKFLNSIKDLNKNNNGKVINLE